jgi:hypothetical protein
LGALAVPDPDIYKAKDNAMPMDLFPEEPLISRRLNVAMSRCEPMRPMTSQTWHLPMRELGADRR